MKYLYAILILLIMTIIALMISGCSRYCEPGNIMSGKSSQHHDTRKFRATYLRQGNFYVVTYKNMQEERKVVAECKPAFRNGSWVFIEPYCK